MSETPLPQVEEPPGGSSPDTASHALDLRIRQQEILAELGVMSLRGTPFPELLEAVDRLRERFRRDQGAKVGGYGLGLAIVGELMRQVGGQLQLQSPASGRSTGFEAIMTLPAA